ncbi:30 kDa heat shock protein [Xylaria castorea]|nr:30 kDa heat shock protein [Xylaria castorea]
MSVFTHHPFYAANNDFGNFGGLVRFIDDWDKHVSQKNDHDGQPRSTRRNVQTFTPRFDVRETEENYELHGELPGVNKKDVNIEFSDAQTVIIRGNVERTYTAGNPPAGLVGDSTMSGTITNEPHNEDNSETRSNKSFKATVEDEKEGAEDNAATSGPVVESSKPETPAESQQQQQKHKYWVYERSIGNFSRTFTFSNRVDHDNVSASMDNGILTVIVPKSKKPETRHIAIN